MNLGFRLKSLRREIGLSQEAVGAQGFVSAPGWIKIENNQRQASEKLIERFTQWLVEEKYLRAGAAQELKDDLLILKYLHGRAPFLRRLAEAYAQAKPDGGTALLADLPAGYKPTRGRPRKHVPGDVALVAETAGIYKTTNNRRKKAGK